MRRKIVIGIIICIAVFGSLFAYKAGRTITVIGSGEDVFWNENETVSFLSPLPDREENRIDILFIGMRGAPGEDEEWGNGEFLADTIIVASLDTESGRAAIVSIPRDLYVDIPGYGNEKINAAYAIGEGQNPQGGGLQLMKTLVSSISMVHIDHAMRVDFRGFQKIIDHLGGVIIYRSIPFEEPKQWIHDGKEGARYWRFEEGSTSTEPGWVFSVPAGTNEMNSEEVLYYARSRFSSSDFDRMRRQQEVISAVKSKAMNLGVLANPVRLFGIMDALGASVRTDMSFTEMKDLVELVRSRQVQDFRKAVLDSSEQGLLVDDKIEGTYVLLPKSGDYTEIRKLFQEIIQ